MWLGKPYRWRPESYVSPIILSFQPAEQEIWILMSTRFYRYNVGQNFTRYQKFQGMPSDERVYKRLQRGHLSTTSDSFLHCNTDSVLSFVECRGSLRLQSPDVNPLWQSQVFTLSLYSRQSSGCHWHSLGTVAIQEC